MRKKPVRLVAATFILELPIDLGLDPGLAVPPIGRTIYGRAKTRIFLAHRTDSSALSVPDVLSPLGEFFEGIELRLDPGVDWPRLTRSSTVAAVTVLHPTRAAQFRPTDRWMTLRFEEALRALDRVLVCIGFVSGLPDIGAVRRTDFPSSVLAAVDDKVLEEEEPRSVLLTELQLHGFEEWTDVVAGRMEIFETAIWLADHLEGAGAPLRLFIDFSQRSRRDLLDGLTAQSVVAAAIAAETAVAATLTAEWRAAGAEEALVRRRMDAGFQNLLRDHLRPYLKSTDGDDAILDSWTEGCYRVRNRVVHEGFVPPHDVAKIALEQTIRLGVTLAEALRHGPRTRALGHAIPLRARADAQRGQALLARLARA